MNSCQPTPELLSQKEFASLLGISAPMVTKHKKAGRLVMDGSHTKLVRVAESLAAIDAWKDPARGGDRSTRPSNTGIPLSAARAERTQPAIHVEPSTVSSTSASDADRLNYNVQAARHKLAEAQRSELMLAREAGELVSKAERDAAEFSRARAAREAIMSIADRIATRVAAESDPHKCHQMIELECRRVCDSLAVRSPSADAVAAA